MNILGNLKNSVIEEFTFAIFTKSLLKDCILCLFMSTVSDFESWRGTYLTSVCFSVEKVHVRLKWNYFQANKF